MGLETGTNISQLNSAWPLSSDNVSQADDHIRLIKSILQAQFPGAGGSGFAAPITATETELNYVDGVTSPIQTQINTVNSTVSTHTGQIATLTSDKAPIASPALTGTPTAPTAAANTSTTQIATTAFANPASNIATNGYVKLPSGLIIQWEYFVVPVGGVSHVFALPFPTACVFAVAQGNYLLVNNIAVYNLVRTSVSLVAYDSSNAWVSVGAWLLSLGY